MKLEITRGEQDFSLKSFVVLFVTILALAFVAQSALAVDISDVTVSVDGNEVNFIQFQSPQVVSLSFTINTPYELSQINADYSSLNLDPAVQSEYSAMNLLSSCDALYYNETFEEPKGYECSSQIILRPSATALNVSYDVVLTNFSNGDVVENLTVQQTLYFTQDTTNPQITSITSDYCVDGICYVGDDHFNKITFGVSDTLGSFYQKKVFYSLTGQKYRVNNCTGSTCEGYAYPSCDSKSTVSLQTTTFNGVISSDDAGNYFTGLTSQDFICDALQPEPVSDITLRATGVDYTGVFKQGDSVTAWVLVKEDSPHLKAYANLSSLTGQEQPQQASCQQLSVEDFGENMYNCSWVFSQILAGDHTFDLTFTDVVEQSSTSSSFMSVDEFVDSADEELPEIFYDITAEPLATEGYNRVAMRIAQHNGILYPIAANIELQKKYPGVVQTLTTTIDSYNCMYVYGEESRTAAGSFDISIANPLTNYDNPNKILITIQKNADVNDFNSDFDIVCNASAIVRLDNNKVYQTPDTFLITIPIHLKNSALGDETPGERMAEAIYNKEKALNENWQIIASANKIMDMLSGLCALEGVLVNSQMTGTMLKMAGDGLEKAGVGGGVNQLIQTIATPLIGIGQLNNDARATGVNANDVSRYSQMYSDVSSSKKQDSGVTNLISKACEFTRCNVGDKIEKAEDEIAANDGERGFGGWWLGANANIGASDPDEVLTDWEGVGVDTWGELTQNIQTPNPKESMITSAVTMCFPGILYHLNQFREMECQSLLCLKGTSKYGFDIEVCDEMRQQWMCEKLVGEAFEIPGARQVKNFADNVNSFLQNIVPNALKIVSQNTFCKNYLEVPANVETPLSWQFYACQVPQSLGEAMNYIDKTTATAENFYYESEGDYCQQALGEEEADFGDMFGVDIPPEVGSLLTQEDGSILASEVLALLKTASSGGTQDEQRQAQEKLQEFGYQKAFLDSYEQVRSQITLLEKLVAKDPKTKITIDANGQIDVSFSELAPFGDAYSQALSTCGHASIRNNYQNDLVNQYIDGYAQENNIPVYFYGRQQPDKIQSVDSNTDALFSECDAACINFCSPLGVSVSSDPSCYKNCYSNCLSQNGYSAVSSQAVVIGGTLGSQLVAQNILSEEELEEITSLLSKCKSNHEIEVERASVYVTTLKNSIQYDCGDSSMQAICDRWKKDLDALDIERLIFSSDSNDFLNTDGPGMMDDGSGIFGTGGIASNDINFTSNFPDDETKYSLKQTQNLYEDKLSSARAQAARQKIANTMDAAFMTAAKNGMLDWMNLRRISDDNPTGLGQVSSFLDAYVDSDSWKTLICSAAYVHPREAQADHGAAIECNNGVCQPVLSFAAEKTKFNDTHQLYTFTYYVGGGQYETSDEVNEYIRFMPRFKKEGEIKGTNFLELVDMSLLNRVIQAPRGGDSLEEITPQAAWMQLPAGQVISDQLTFASEENFTTLCIDFERAYPPNDPLRKKQYCRDISDELVGESAWDTGRPTGTEDCVYDPEEEANGWLDNWDGRLIITV